ncbi:MAG: hypothetical protein HY560_13690, partial [Gemmatimonadetes bacterium]|nr:hypothetical protein [Gemmatimonadota bacterium]
MKLMTRALWLAVVAALAAVPAQAQQVQRTDDPDKDVAGGGKLPEGWSAKTDKGRPLTNVKFWKMGEGWHFTLGPAVIVYQEPHTASGDYRAAATFTQTKAAEHAEGYGLFVGGKNL